MKKSYDKNRVIIPIYIFALLFISGVVAGSAAAVLSKTEFVLNPSVPDKAIVFTSSFKAFLKPCIIIWLSGFTGISVYISALTLAYRGGMFGFVICILFKTYGLSGGILKALCATLPQNIIYFPFLLFLSLSCARQNGKKPATGIILFITAITVCAVSALTDAYITSALIDFTFR